MPIKNNNTNILSRYPIVISIIISVIVLVVFSGVLTADFVKWDDDINLAKLRGLSFQRIGLIFTDLNSMNRYVPLFFLTQNIIYHFYHLNAFVYHMVNWLVYGLNAGLLFLLIRKMMLISLKTQGDNRKVHQQINIAATLATLLWALHPLRVETVALASNLTHNQAVLFLLLSVLCYLEAITSESDKKRYIGFIAAVFIFYTASLFTHAIGMTCFALFFVMDFFLFKRIGGAIGWWKSGTAKKVLLEKVILTIPPFFAILMSIIVRIKSAGVSQPAISLSDFGILDRIMQAMYIISYYLWRPFYPVDLSPIYNTLFHFDPLSTPFIVSTFVFVAVSAVLFIFRKRWPLLIALGLAYLILLFPFMGFSEHPHVHSDRYSLLPSICLSILIAFGLITLMKNKYLSVMSMGALIIIISILGWMSTQQIKIWHNSETLFLHMIKSLGNEPHRQDIYYRLGAYLYEKGRKEEAILNYEKALEINPYNLQTNARMAEIELKNNHIEKSIYYLQNVLAAQPNNFVVHYWLSQLYNTLGRKEEARYHMSRAVEARGLKQNAQKAQPGAQPK